MKPKRYILFNDEQVFDLLGDQIISSFNVVNKKKAQSEFGVEKAFIEIYYHDGRGDYCEYDGKGGRTMDWWYLNQIVRQADTIEDLCDEFRGVWKNYYKKEKKDAHEEYHYDKEKGVYYNEFEELTPEEAVEKFDLFYGAVWTYSGLKYIAIMEKRGELKLI